LRFLQIQSESVDSVRELDHLVEHHIAQAFETGDGVARIEGLSDVMLNSIISLSITSLKPSMRATPSPVSRTTPTLVRVVDVFNPAIFVSISSSMVLIGRRVVISENQNHAAARLSSRRCKRLRTEPSQTSLPTRIRSPPRSSGVTANSVVRSEP